MEPSEERVPAIRRAIAAAGTDPGPQRTFPRAADTDGAADLPDVVRRLGRYWWLIAVLVALGVAAGLARGDERAYTAMLTAAKTLVQEQFLDVPDEPNTIVNEFRTRMVDTKLFWDKYHADQFSRYLFARHEGADTRYTSDTAHKLVEEANLFIDAAHKCLAKMQAEKAAAVVAK